MAKLKLGAIEAMLKNGKAFELTEEQYRANTGCNFPQDPNYIVARSAIARIAKEYGYKLEFVPLKVIPARIKFDIESRDE